MCPCVQVAIVLTTVLTSYEYIVRMLLPPLKFIFKSKRVVRHGQPDRFPTELIVRGHYVTAVDFVGKPLHWCLDFKRCEYGDKAKEKYKQALARSLLMSSSSTIIRSAAARICAK